MYTIRHSQRQRGVTAPQPEWQCAEGTRLQITHDRGATAPVVGISPPIRSACQRYAYNANTASTTQLAFPLCTMPHNPTHSLTRYAYLRHAPVWATSGFRRPSLPLLSQRLTTYEPLQGSPIQLPYSQIYTTTTHHTSITHVTPPHTTKTQQTPTTLHRNLAPPKHNTPSHRRKYNNTNYSPQSRTKRNHTADTPQPTTHATRPSQRQRGDTAPNQSGSVPEVHVSRYPTTEERKRRSWVSEHPMKCVPEVRVQRHG